MHTLHGLYVINKTFLGAEKSHHKLHRQKYPFLVFFLKKNYLPNQNKNTS